MKIEIEFYNEKQNEKRKRKKRNKTDVAAAASVGRSRSAPSLKRRSLFKLIGLQNARAHKLGFSFGRAFSFYAMSWDSRSADDFKSE